MIHCLNCGNLIRAERGDLRYYEPRQRWYGWDQAEVCIRCEECGDVTDLEKDQWPENVDTLKPWTLDWVDGFE
jgi:hypothetical protein